MLVSLRNYSNYSICESNIKIDDLVNFASKNNLSAIGLTDYKLLSGSLEFSIKCQKAGIQPIIGLDIDYVSILGHSKRVTFLSKSEEGFKNLNILSTEVNTNNNFLLNENNIKDYANGNILILGGLYSYFDDIPINQKNLNKVLNEIKNLKELKATGYKSKSIKDELSDNLTELIKSGKPSFPNIHGYENTVIPDLERAILSRHNINFLGLRGQAKTRLARMMVKLLDEWVPIWSGCNRNQPKANAHSSHTKSDESIHRVEFVCHQIHIHFNPSCIVSPKRVLKVPRGPRITILSSQIVKFKCHEDSPRICAIGHVFVKQSVQVIKVNEIIVVNYINL